MGRKPLKNTKIVYIRLSEPEYEEYMDQARKEDRSLTYIIRRILRKDNERK
jgi:hypothetical protein